LTTGICALPAAADQFSKFRLPSAKEPLYGTWINESYAGQSSESAQKLIYYKWGYGEVYSKASGTNPADRFTFILVETWTDSDGYTWYKEFDQMPYGSNFYCLTRINKDRNTLETVSSIGTMDFPNEVDLNPERLAYRVYYKR
jgi:hypothetical protein